MSGGEIKVLVVDDSAVVRQVLTSLLTRDPAIASVETAQDPVFAMARMQRSWPDVVVLDIEMPRMDGITFLKQIMATRPTPVVICSTLTQRGAETTMEALSAGASGVVPKPTLGLKEYLQEDTGDVVAAVKAAAAGNTRRLRPVAPPKRDVGGAVALPRTTDRLVAIGTSTGGTQALEVVLTALPRVSPGIVIVQHMPERFTAAFAERMDSLCAIEVKEAEEGDRVIPGRAIVAPGGHHLEVYRDGAQYRVTVMDGPPVNRHRPSVDVLFRSVAKAAGRNALGIVMTGMGDDGARGLYEMHRAGSPTIVQDEESCVVYGMPKEAVRLGAADRELPLSAIAEVIRSHA